MHLLIPFAFSSSEGCGSALPTLTLPNLGKLLARLTPTSLDAGDEFSLSPPHERARARALGLPVRDGLIPWAAWQAHEEGAWGFITPCHWQAGTHQITMSGQTLADFSEQESQALLAAMRPYFEEDGITLRFEEPGRWLARGDLFDGLATASLDRVMGRNLENWMPRGANAVNLRRLQNEMQMLLYTHPINDARAARGAPVVNSFWLSGTGVLPRHQPLASAAKAAPPVIVTSLRDAALNEDWASWIQAWHQVDATQCAAMRAALERGERCELTLCGERNAQTLNSHLQSVLRRFLSVFGSKPPSTLISTL